MIDRADLVGEYKVGVFEHRKVLEARTLRALESARRIAGLEAAAGDFSEFVLVNEMTGRNAISLEYYDLMFNVILKGDPYSADVRIGVYENDVTPSESLKIDTFRATLGEFTAYTVDGGNTQNRASTTFASSSGQSITNDASPSRFTMTGSGTLYGAFLVHGAPLKDGSGDSAPAVYIAGFRFDQPQPVSNGSVIDVVYTQRKA